MKTIQTHAKYLFVTSFFVLLAACGQGVPPIPTPAPGGNLAYRCQARAGAIINLPAGGQACQISTYLPYSGSFSFSGSAFPILNPNQPVSANAMSTKVAVAPGDKVVVAAQSKWGSLQSNMSSILGGLISYGTYSWSCDIFNGDGMQLSNNQAGNLYQGLAPGLVLSDGSKLYPVGEAPGATPKQVIMQGSGILSFGFNVPYTSSANYCGSLAIQSFRVLHCEDANGATIACP